jgi:signal transduction histidine kinase
VLRAIRVAKTGGPSPITPVPFDFQTDDLSMLHSEWVTLDAYYLGRREGRVDGILQFSKDGQFFEALLPNKGHDHHLVLTSGDRVRLTGICELTTSHALPRIEWVDGFRIHLPQNGGIEIISRAPWWNTWRLLVALGVMSGVAFLGFFGTWLLRRQVKSQMHIISDKLRTEAVGEERDRMARELHDTLEQQLSGVALQLDSLDHAVNQNPAAASTTLTLARRMLRYTRLEARRSVWDLRSKVLEKDGLSAALRAISETSGPAGPVIDVIVRGDEHPLSAGVDFHLLRIAQEATTNAIKHGTASLIRIELEYLPKTTRLTVTDDGNGFDPAASQPVPGPHFGLLGMRERAAKIGASLTLDSFPGAGCVVTVSLPNETSR